MTVPGLPRFVGGAVGYFSYDTVRSFEELPAARRESVGMPDFAFLLTDTLLIFDNVVAEDQGGRQCLCGVDEGAGHTRRLPACGRRESKR